MKLHDLPKINSHAKKPKRLGCGHGSGHGKTCGKGHKGAKSRSGYSMPRNSSGIPYYRRLPKRGFSNYKFRTVFEVVNLKDLNSLFNDGEEVDVVKLHENGLVRSVKSNVKILGEGGESKKLLIKAHKISAKALKILSDAGGSFSVLEDNVET